MNYYKELDFLDLLAIASFVIGLQNLEENLTQGDKQDIQDDFDEKTNRVLIEIHEHLEMQDIKINAILKILEELHHDC